MPSGSGRNFDHLYEGELARALGVPELAAEVEVVIVASMGSPVGRCIKATAGWKRILALPRRGE